MKLKKIRKGAKIIKFTNINPCSVILYLGKNSEYIPHFGSRAFIYMEANSFAIIESDIFFGFPLKEFPEIQLYAGKRILVESR